MLRTFPTQSLDWPEKTINAVHTRMIDACEERLEKRPKLSLFGACNDQDVEVLWHYSYDAYERPYSAVLHTVRAMQDSFIETLGLELKLMTMEETAIITRLMQNKGFIYLLQPEDMLSAESLAMRHMCTVELPDDGSVCVRMPDEVFDLIYRRGFSDQLQKFRSELSDFEERMEVLLFQEGMMDAQQFLHFMYLYFGDRLPDHERLLQRYMRAAFDCICLPGGRTFIVHPGAVQTETMVENYMAHARLLDPPVGNMFLEADAENDCAWMMHGLIFHRVREELSPEIAVWNLLLMARQNASYEEMVEVLRCSLISEPTQRDLDALKILHAQVPPWKVCVSGRYH